ncbi:MAG: preprotein translocase subunit YajC [Verrucomicrobiota bacterium]
MTYEVFNTLMIFAQTSPAPSEQPSGWVNIMPIVLMFVIFYFLLIRPQMKKQKQHDKMVKELKAGTDVVVAGGIYGRITSVKDESFMVKVADNCKIEVQKPSVISVVSTSEVDKASN